MRVLIIGMHYSPEVSGNAPYTAGLAEHLANRGDQVTVVAGLPHYPDWRLAPRTSRALWSRERIRGVDVLRSAHYVPRSQSALRRAAYEGTFALTGLVAALRVPRPDMILGIVPSLGGGLLARVTAERSGAPYGILFQDLMGPAAGQSGVPGGGRVAHVAAAGEAWAVRGATAVAVVAQAFVPYLEGLGVSHGTIHHVPNWSRTSEPALTVRQTRDLFGWGDEQLVVLHAGNMGYKQGLEQMVDAAKLAIAHELPVRFVLSGGGNCAEAIRDAAAGLPNTVFLGVQPDGIHASLLAAADVLLLSERPSQTDMSLPSKLTSYFAAGRPVVAAVPPSARPPPRSSDPGLGSSSERASLRRCWLHS